MDALGDLSDADVRLDTDKAEDGLDDLKQAAGKAEGAFGDLSSEAKSELGKVETAASSAGREVESELKGGAQDAESAFASLGAKARSDIADIERAAQDADFKVDVAEGVESAAGSAKVAAGALAGEVVDEFVENWGEAVRSGDYGSAVRETLSQLGSIGGAIGGPPGAIIGGALALGLTTGFDKWTNAEGKARIKASTASMFTDVESAELSGRAASRAFTRGFVEEADLGSQISEALDVDSVAEGWLEVARIARETGLTTEEVSRALLGQPGALRQVEAAIADNNAQYEAGLDIQGQIFDTDRAASDQQGLINDALGVRKGELTDLLGLGREQVVSNNQANEGWRTGEVVTGAISDNTGDTLDNVSDLPDRGLPKLARDADQISGNTGDAAANLNATKPPDLSTLVSQTKAARDLAKETRAYWDGMGPKSVALDITYRTRNAPDPDS